MKNIAIIAATVAALVISTGCTVSADKSVEVLSEAGYTDIELGGFTIFGCSDTDDFSRTFTATGLNGSQVEGVLCAGWLKGVTIRLR